MLPHYISVDSYCGSTPPACLSSYVTALTEDTTGGLLKLSDSRKVLQTYNSFSLNWGFLFSLSAIVLYIGHSEESTLTVQNPLLLSGLLLGIGMGSSFPGLLTFISRKLAPIICYDLRFQIDEGAGEVDSYRCHHILTLNLIRKFPYFLPHVSQCLFSSF